jgi:hypothetical protein
VQVITNSSHFKKLERIFLLFFSKQFKWLLMIYETHVQSHRKTSLYVYSCYAVSCSNFQLFPRALHAPIMFLASLFSIAFLLCLTYFIICEQVQCNDF